MRKLTALLLIWALLLTGCATTRYQDAGEISKVSDVLKHGDALHVVRVDGSALDFNLKEITADEVVGYGNHVVAKKDIARIEKKVRTPGIEPSGVAAAGVIIVMLPFMVGCSIITGDNRSSGPCGWGH
ncbi:MAG: hypothetical protein ACJ8GW_07690 [Massilia sp.]